MGRSSARLLLHTECGAPRNPGRREPQIPPSSPTQHRGCGGAFKCLHWRPEACGDFLPQALEIGRVKVMEICWRLKIMGFLVFSPSSLTPWSTWIHWQDKPDTLSTWPHSLGLYPGDFTGVKLTTGELFYCSLTAVQTYGELQVQVKNN